MPLHRTHPVHDVGLLRCCLRCLSASKGRHAGARWNPTETLCGNGSPSGYQSIASGALVLTSVCLSHDMWVMTQLSARIRTKPIQNHDLELRKLCCLCSAVAVFI